MVVLLVFALLAGAATALSPCVLPVLPLALSAGLTGGRRRPLGVVTGLAISFTFAVVALVYVISALGLPGGFLRTVAIVVIGLFGLTLLAPPLAARLEARLTRLTGRAPVPGGQGGGFWSGLTVGGGLGLVYAPCAGPILAGVITASASQSFTAGRLEVALAYGIGSAVVLYALLVGGRRLTSRLAKRSGRFQIAMGAVMVVVALLMLGNYDTRFETAVAQDLPSFLVNPTHGLETSSAVAKRLAAVRGQRHTSQAAGLAQASRASPLPVLGTAPEFVGTQRWFNTPGGRPLTLASLRGRVVLVDFWTYSCINCLRTLPYLKGWDARYRTQGLTIVGVHTPEFPFEHSASNVADAIAQNGIRYPVVQDNNSATWNAYGNQYWPAEYLIDAQGRVRLVHFGEGEYAAKEQAIRGLLIEAGAARLAAMTHTRAQQPSTQQITPESYLGAARAERFAAGSVTPGVHDYGRLPARPALGLSMLRYGGRWRIADLTATALPGARLALDFRARRVYLVLGSPGATRQVRVLLDGRPIAPSVSGADVRHSTAAIGFQRLYRLVNLPRVERHVLTLDFASGVRAYAFTFG
ncbi:MAG TPA: cytochrome c biogenesis protein DipZ [Solirubrobacteraceae bacterium]|nr:cytochrome c biogenesis protein DipZ [Solirubrobacteraceae bacterium]